MAKTTSVGYIAARRQASGRGVPAVMTTSSTDNVRRFFRYRTGVRSTPNATNTRYREGGGGRDVTLSLKEGIASSIEMPIFARPVSLGFMMQALTGPSALGVAGGGTSSNGLIVPPKLATTTPANATLTMAIAAGNVGSVTTTTSTNTFAAKKIVVGWGPNMEFLTVAAGSTSAFTPTAAMLYPHAIGEPAYEVNGYGTTATAIAPTGATFDLVAGHGLTTGIFTASPCCIGGMSTAARLGSELGNSEKTAVGTTIATNAVTLPAGCRNGHSIGCWVYQGDEGVTASAIHCFEPVEGAALDVDYFTLARSAGGGTIFEFFEDCKLGQFVMSGESPGPVNCQVTFDGRQAKGQAATLTEDYTYQDPVADLPFRMTDYSAVISVGGEINHSSKMRQFSWTASNTLADNMYTNAISRDDIVGLAREANFGAQFYFTEPDEYYQTYYGASTVANTAMSAVATSASILLNFTIGVGTRASIYIPAMTWETWPVELNPEPEVLVVDGAGVPLKSGSIPLYTMAVQNKDLGYY